MAEDVVPLISDLIEGEERFPAETLHLTTAESSSITKFAITGDVVDLPRDIGTMYLSLRRDFSEMLGETTAEDVAFAALLKACQDYRPGVAGPKTWARRNIKQALQKAVRKQESDERWLRALRVVTPSTHWDDLEDVWEEREETARAALSMLDERELRIVIAPHEGVGDKQLASELATTPSALSTHRYRIMQHLRDVIVG